MKFESSEQLQNHLKKFCQGSDYADLFKLEEKYKSEMKKQKQSQGAFTGEEYQQFLSRSTGKEKVRLMNENQMSVQELKDKLKERDDEFKKLERVEARKQDDVLDSEMNRIKEERQKIRLKKKEDENVLQDLLYELEQKKEKEIRARIEKDQIRRALVDLENAKLSAIGTEKKRELEKLVHEREALRLKEKELVSDIENLESNSKNLDIMRNEELQRMHKVVDGLQFSKKENNKVNEKMIEEKAERMAQIKLRREMLENERVRIMNNLEKLRAGETKGVIGQPGMNFGLISAKNIIGDMRDLAAYNVPGLREKVRAEEDRIRGMKNDNASMYKREFMPYDGDEIFGNKGDAGAPSNYPHRMQDYYNNFAEKVNNDPQRLNALRTNIEGIANQRGPAGNDMSRYADHKINDLAIIKQDYAKSGGTDPKMLENLQNLERFYNGAKPPQDNQMTFQPQSLGKPQSAVYGNGGGGSMNSQSTAHFFGAQSNGGGDSIDAMVSFKQQENERLKQQIQMLRNGGGGGMNAMNTAGMGMMNMNDAGPMGGGMMQSQSMMAMRNNVPIEGGGALPNPFSMFTANNEYFMHQEVRNVDLDKEERQLLNIAQQEIDELRVVSRIPVGTEIYRFKMEQFKQLSQTRAEIEKVVQEQRLGKMRRRFEMQRKYLDRRFDNQRWIDDQRRWILAARLRKEGDVDNTGALKDYDANQGFIVHWDYELGLPKRTQLSQVVFGIYNRNETLFQPKLVDPHDTEVESAQTVRCIIGESNQVFDIPADPDTLMIMEVQFPYSKNLSDNIGRTDTFGWTQVDLFDFKRQLKRGRFKCPLYYGPTDVNISIPEIKNLEPIPGAWIYFRIAYPNDPEYGTMPSLYPDHTMHQYIIPQIHLRNVHGARQEIIDLEDDPEPLPNLTYIRPPSDQSMKPRKRTPVEAEPDPPPQLEYFYPRPKSNTNNNDSSKDLDDLAGGLAVTVSHVISHVARSHCRVQVRLLEDKSIVTDENGLACDFNTSTHNPLNNKIKFNLLPTVIIDNEVQNPHLDNMNNKEQGQDIRFQERYRFLRHVLRLYKQNKKDLWLDIKLLEKPEPIELQDKKLVDTSINYGGLEFVPIGWNLFKIMEGGKIKEKEHKIKLYQMPQLMPPNIDYSRAREMSAKTQIVINLERIPFGEKELRRARDAKKRRKRPDESMTQDNPTKSKTVGALNQNAFIDNVEQQWQPEAVYTRNMGIDVYIDGMRFLPDRVTVTKILMDVFNNQLEEVFKQESCQPNLSSTQYMPVYEYRRELRKEVIDPTSMILLTIITYDSTAKVTKRVGYAGIPLFINPYTKEQPSERDENDFCIFEGSYQLPIFSQEVDRNTFPFNLKSLEKLERIPCATLLLRIRKAALSDDGRRSLSIKEFEEKDWIRKGLFEPRPNYNQQVYNTQFIQLTEPEVGLFESRKQRVDQNIEELIYVIDKNLKKGGLKKFLDEKLVYTPGISIIDMMYFAKYDSKVGIKVSLDGLHKVPNAKWIYAGLISLNPPGEFYPESQMDNPIGDNVKLVSNLNLGSAAESPKFRSDFIYYRDQPFNRYLSLIVDIKAVSANTSDKKMQNVGWTMVPLFSPDGYALSKAFQLPLIKGPVDPAIVKQMEKRDPWELFPELISNSKSGVKYLQYTSIIIRVVDAQREGHFKNPYDIDNFDYRYLPNPKKDWSYIPASEIQLKNARKIYQNYSEFKTVPNRVEEQQFNQTSQYDFASSFGLNQYIDGR